MASRQETRHADSILSPRRIVGMLGEIRARIAQARVYRQTVNRLSALSEAELSELGLSGSMIRPVARRTALGG